MPIITISLILISNFCCPIHASLPTIADDDDDFDMKFDQPYGYLPFYSFYSVMLKIFNFFYVLLSKSGVRQCCVELCFLQLQSSTVFCVLLLLHFNSFFTLFLHCSAMAISFEYKTNFIATVIALFAVVSAAATESCRLTHKNILFTFK